MNRLRDLKPLARFSGRIGLAPRLRDVRERPWHRDRLAELAADRRRAAQLNLLIDLLATGATDDAIVDALLALPAMPWREAA